jgi:hypothetical protein
LFGAPHVFAHVAEHASRIDSMFASLFHGSLSETTAHVFIKGK